LAEGEGAVNLKKKKGPRRGGGVISHLVKP
jgi:hypothetical protein